MRACDLSAALLLLLATPAKPETADVGFLILDLEGDGLLLSDAHYPVLFDADGDGLPELCSWTAQAQSEAFLWLDLDHNGRVDHGGELIGGATSLPPGLPHAHAFEVLSALDDPSLGGNGDGRLSHRDRLWSELRLWIDADHDGRSNPAEVTELEHWGIRRIGFAYETGYELDGGLNLHRRWGTLEISPRPSRTGDRKIRETTLTEVFFQLGGVPEAEARLTRSAPPANR